MKKKIFTAALAAAISGIMGITALAAGWQQDSNGWWYGTNADNTAYHANGWQWIDSNGNGTAECYYFGADGYCLTGTTTPDGYTVNSDGAWIIDGVIQTSQTGSQTNSVQTTDTPVLNGLYFDTNWNYYYYLKTLDDGSLQVLLSDAGGAQGSVYLTLPYKGNNAWHDASGTDEMSLMISNHAWLTDTGVRISMGGYIQRNLVAQ